MSAKSQVESPKFGSCKPRPVNGTIPVWMMTDDHSHESSKIKVCVLGAGSLGKEHARIYAELAAAGQVEFVGLYDVAAENARKVSEKYRVRSFGSAGEAMAAAEALSVVTPTTTHFDLAKTILHQGKH